MHSLTKDRAAYLGRDSDLITPCEEQPSGSLEQFEPWIIQSVCPALNVEVDCIHSECSKRLFIVTPHLFGFAAGEGCDYNLLDVERLRHALEDLLVSSLV